MRRNHIISVQFLLLTVLLVTLILTSCADHGVISEEGGHNDDHQQPATVSFSEDVHPVLLRSCAFNSCHGNVNPQHGVNVTSYQTLVGDDHGGHKYAGSLHNPVIRGDGFNSPLYVAVSPRYRELGLDFRMPKFSDTLTTLEQENIRVWIDEGALNN